MRVREKYNFKKGFLGFMKNEKNRKKIMEGED